MARKIYFLGGNLDILERERLFHGKFRKLIRDGLATDFEDIDYDFVVKDRCTGAEFKQIWSDADTYGIVWFGHGRTDGLPATSEASDGSRTINPLTLAQSSKNLQFAAILSCMSDKWQADWRAKMANRDAPLKLFHGTITAHTGKLAGTLERWLGSRRSWFASKTNNLSAMLKAAAKAVREKEGTAELLPDQRISADHFEPDRIYVPTVIIPRAGGGRRGIGGRPAGTGRKPVVAPEPQGQIVPPRGTQTQVQNRQGQWRIRTGAPTGTTGAAWTITRQQTGATERAAEIERQRRASERRAAERKAAREAADRASRERRQNELERQRLEAARRQRAREQARAALRVPAPNPYRFWGMGKPKVGLTQISITFGAGPMRQKFPGEKKWRIMPGGKPVTFRWPIHH